MQSDGHLVSTFYITKPIPFEPQPHLNTSTSSHHDNSPNCPIVEHQTVSPVGEEAVRVKRGYSKVYHMVSKQINCSAAVKIGEKMKFSKMHSQTEQVESNLNNQLELFLKEWLDTSHTERSTKRKQSSKKTTYLRYETFSHDPQLDTSEEDRRVTINPKNTKQIGGYYQRMRNNLSAKVGHLVRQDSQPNKHKIHPVETVKQGEKSEVKKILKDKHKVRKNEALRLSRTGLQIRLLEIERTAKGTNLTMIEHHKAKKDTIFQKSLLKNCNAILSDIQSYQQLLCSRGSADSSQSSLHYHSPYLPAHPHLSCRRPKQPTIRSSSDDLQKLKWRQKYLQIESQCQQTCRGDGKLRGGLQVFKKFCGRLSKKLECDQKSIKNILQQQQRSKGGKEIYEIGEGLLDRCSETYPED